ncbi:MAG: ABC transporter ATP-binding protein [Sphingomonas sp.]|uniref:ABC transporter ATP-binding protein n=1 Tax=Sphingomonas sp. TaxID=28214 RepID=UPI0022750A38|nr:ABC transporter ATP-binding protein [Sphingomonas sp.]MCX8477810.1 ABC transporter ATP-binding protein [Sphingomonas sp.]
MRRDAARLREFATDLLRADGSCGAPPLLLALAGAILEGAGLILLVPIIAVLGAESTVTQTPAVGITADLLNYLPLGKPARLSVLLVLFGALMLLRSIIIVARDVSFARLTGAFLERTRAQVLDRIVGVGWNRLAGLQHGRVSHLLSADFQACALAGTSLIGLCISGILLAMLLVVAFTLSPLLAATALLSLLALIGVLYPTLALARSSGAELVEVGVKLTSDLGQFLGGLKLVLGNNLGKAVLAHIADLQREQTRLSVSFARQQSRTHAAILLSGGAIGAVALLVGGLVLNVPAPQLMATLVILARLGGPALQFQRSLQLLLYALPTYERVKALKEELWSPTTATAIPAEGLPEGGIELDRVTYLHAETEEAAGGVRDLNLVLRPGTAVAIVGSSGAGKTTLADLLGGLIMPQSGSIRVGGVVLTAPNLEHWRSAISYVPQDSFLLNDTIRNNLLWGSPGASDEELRIILEIAAADALVEARPGGLDASVGERGILLSGGERQRVALARALLRRPRLIILDEATNALDPVTEERILARLVALPNRPTIIAISHRTAALEVFDAVYRIERGRLT